MVNCGITSYFRFVNKFKKSEKALQIFVYVIWERQYFLTHFSPVSQSGKTKKWQNPSNKCS